MGDAAPHSRCLLRMYNLRLSATPMDATPSSSNRGSRVAKKRSSPLATKAVVEKRMLYLYILLL